MKRWENSNGEKSGFVRSSFQTPPVEAHLVDARDSALVEVVLEEGAAALVPADHREPVRRLGDRHRPALEHERLLAHPLERHPRADVRRLVGRLLARHHHRHAPLADQRLQALVLGVFCACHRVPPSLLRAHDTRLTRSQNITKRILLRRKTGAKALQ